MPDYTEKFEKMRVAGKLAAQTLDMLTDSIKEGVAMAQDAIGAGLARAKLTDLATFTQVQQDA